MDKHRRWLIPVGIFLACLIVYSILHLVYVEQDDRWTTDGDEVNYLVVTESIIEDHDLSPLNNYFERCYLENGYYQAEIDFPYEWENSILMLVPGHEGRMVYTHLPLMSIILVPGFWLFGYHGAAFTMILMTCFAAVFMFLILRKLVKEMTALAATMAFFLTYPVITYSRLIYPATVMIFILSISVWAALRLKESGKWGYALLLGLVAAVTLQLHVKYLTIVAALIILPLTCSRRRIRDMVLWLAPVAFSFVLLLLITRYLYGADLRHGLTVSSGGGGFFGVHPFYGIFGLYLDRAWGLFILAPLYLVFIPGIPLPRSLKEVDRWWIFIPVCIVLHTLMSGLFGKWSGDCSPIPRQLMPMIPLLIICAAVFYDRLRGMLLKVLVGLLLVYQVVLTVFELAHPRAAFAIPGGGYAILHEVFGSSWLSKSIYRVFPLLHPTYLKSGVLPLLFWLVAIVGVSYYLRKYRMSSVYLAYDRV